MAGEDLVFAVNGEKFEVLSVNPSTTLLEFLRSNTCFKSVKLSCGEGKHTHTVISNEYRLSCFYLVYMHSLFEFQIHIKNCLLLIMITKILQFRGPG